MKWHASLVLVSGLLAGPSFAQSVDLAIAPPAILQLQMETLKPGKSGEVHMKSEAAFTRAQKAAKSQIYYLGMTSLSGPSQALFVSGYASFADLEKENATVAANPALAAGFDHALLADGDLLSNYENSLYLWRPDLSLPGSMKLTATRFFEITTFKVKPGHEVDFEQLAGMYQDAFKKCIPGEEFILYESLYGKANGGLFLVVIPYTSLAMVDTGNAGFAKIPKVEGADFMKKLDVLTAASVDSQQTNLYQVAPQLSFSPAAWGTADPFWKPKASSAPKAKATP